MTTSLDRQRRYWDDLARLDPLWAILTESDRKHGGWVLEDFFSTGETEIDGVMAVAETLGRPVGRISALDFGCGVGRITRALARRFREATGVDVSEAMVAVARKLNFSLPTCKFLRNAAPHLEQFSDHSFDLIYSNRVLQHVPTRAGIKRYVREFVRTLKEGGLLTFQLPSYIPVRHRIQIRRRLYGLFRALGLGRGVLYEKLGLHPMSMTFVPEEEVCALIRAAGGRILDVREDPLHGAPIRSHTYYVTR